MNRDSRSSLAGESSGPISLLDAIGRFDPSQPISEDLSSPQRSAKLRRLGFDPTRFRAFLETFSVADRRQFLYLLDHAPTMLLSVREGSPERDLFQRARMTKRERDVWEAEQRASRLR